MSEIQPIKNFRDYKRVVRERKKNVPDLNLYFLAFYLEPRFYDEKAEKKVRGVFLRKQDKYKYIRDKIAALSNDPMLDKICIKNYDDFKRELVKQKERHPYKTFLEILDELAKHFQNEDIKSKVLDELRSEADKYADNSENKIIQLKIALYEIWNHGVWYVYDFDDFRWKLLVERADNPNMKLTNYGRELTKRFYKKDENDAYAEQNVKDALGAVLEKYPRINSAEALLENICKSAPEYEKNIAVFSTTYLDYLFNFFDKM